MKKQFFILLFLTLAAYGQQERIAIINTMDDRDSIGISDLTYLTDRIREAAVNLLPKQRFGVMTTESIVAFLGSQENTAKVCKEASCLAELGRKVSADYVAQGRIGRFGENLTIKVELYDTQKGNLMGSFTGNSKDIFGLLSLIDQKSSDLFKRMLEESTVKPTEPVIVVEKPEVAKIEPKPEPPKPAPMPKVKEGPKKTSFWVALGLDMLGAGLMVAGYLKDKELKDSYKTYGEKGLDQSHYDNTWDDVESIQSQRNVFYGIGSIFLVSGVGISLWF
ncbi:MAG: hypothetical protein LBC75_10455 [Fibromonadaceae bacterium]|jgi:TolB-like protein|nr:hypothetical protein [Fibromonadaceae bacterium]